ncbi:hypothetical protein PO124_32855 [Bacillus licheniformis]|nr:hypothetical protein [Bacillus licheniformis]
MLKPLGDRVVIELVESEEKLLAESYFLTPQRKPQEGKVVAAGSGRVLESGERVALEVKQATASSSQICRYRSEI